jgi:hypothetical protein
MTFQNWQNVGVPGQLPPSPDIEVLFKQAIMEAAVDEDAAMTFWGDEFAQLAGGQIQDAQVQAGRYWSSWERWLTDIMGQDEAERRMKRIRELQGSMLGSRFSGGYGIDPNIRYELLAYIEQTEQDALELQQAGPAEAPASVAA